MGKIRAVTLGDEKEEKEQKKKADARRETKKAKKVKSDGDKASGNDTSGIKAEYLAPTEEQQLEGEEKKKSQIKKPKKVKSKRYLEVSKMVDKNKLYPIGDAVSLLKQTTLTKFDGTVEIHVNLNPQLLGGKTELRGVVTLPHGSGKEIKVAIADDELLAKVEAGVIDFDILVAHPSMMAKLAKYARVLGPKGLMPNPKNGTVSPDPEKRVKELSGGQVNFKTEPIAPIIHLPIGKVSYEAKQIHENIQALFLAIGKSKILRATITSTMGPGIKLDTYSL